MHHNNNNNVNNNNVNDNKQQQQHFPEKVCKITRMTTFPMENGGVRWPTFSPSIHPNRLHPPLGVGVGDGGWGIITVPPAISVLAIAMCRRKRNMRSQHCRCHGRSLDPRPLADLFYHSKGSRAQTTMFRQSRVEKLRL